MREDLVFHICPAFSIENDIVESCSYIIISTGNRYDVLDTKDNVCVLHFADTEDPKKSDRINNNDIEIIFDFINKCESEDVYIACDSGISRSSAVSAALLRCAEKDDSSIFRSDEYDPNIYVYYSILYYYYTEISKSRMVEEELKTITTRYSNNYHYYKHYRKHDYEVGP